jgi:hypothetical protein
VGCSAPHPRERYVGPKRHGDWQAIGICRYNRLPSAEVLPQFKHQCRPLPSVRILSNDGERSWRHLHGISKYACASNGTRISPKAGVRYAIDELRHRDNETSLHQPRPRTGRFTSRYVTESSSHLGKSISQASQHQLPSCEKGSNKPDGRTSVSKSG